MVSIVAPGTLDIVQDFFRKLFINQYELIRSSSLSIASRDQEVVVIRFSLTAIDAVAATPLWKGAPPPSGDRFLAGLRSLLNCSARTVRVGGEVMRGYEVPAHMVYRLVGVDFMNADGREPALVAVHHDLADTVR